MATFDVAQQKAANGWNDNTAIQEAFDWAIQEVKNGGAPTIHFAAGTYALTTNVSTGSAADKTPINITGGAALNKSHTINLWNRLTIEHPVTMSGLYIRNRGGGSNLYFRRPDTGGDEQKQDDMDSTITFCNFGGKGSSSSDVDIDYRGRNLIARYNHFITGGPGVGIKLSYYNNPNENYSQGTGGWKRIVVEDNTFHNYQGGLVQIAGGNGADLQLSEFNHNLGETNCKLIWHSSSQTKVKSCQFVNNTVQSTTRYMKIIDLKRVDSCIINDNILMGTNNTQLKKRLVTHVAITDGYNVDIKDNQFHWANGTAYDGSIYGHLDQSTVTGNSWPYGSTANRFDFTGTGNTVQS